MPAPQGQSGMAAYVYESIPQLDVDQAEFLAFKCSACSESGIFSYSIAKYANIFLWFQQNLMSKDHLPYSPLLRQTALEQECCPAERGILGHRYTYNDKTLHLVFTIWQLPLESCRTEHLLKPKNHEK